MRFILNFCTFTALASSAFAHPGHGETAPESVSHWFIEPQHNWWIGVALVLLALILWSKKSESPAEKSIARKEK